MPLSSAMQSSCSPLELIQLYPKLSQSCKGGSRSQTRLLPPTCISAFLIPEPSPHTSSRSVHPNSDHQGGRSSFWWDQKGGCWYRQQCLHLADPHMQPWLFQREASMPQGCPQQCFTCPLLLHWNQSLAAPQFKRRNIGLRCWSRSWFSLLWWLRWHSKLSSEDTGD